MYQFPWTLNRMHRRLHWLKGRQRMLTAPFSHYRNELCHLCFSQSNIFLKLPSFLTFQIPSRQWRMFIRTLLHLNGCFMMSTSQISSVRNVWKAWLYSPDLYSLAYQMLYSGDLFCSSGISVLCCAVWCTVAHAHSSKWHWDFDGRTWC